MTKQTIHIIDFKILYNILDEIKDYLKACEYKTTFFRIGSKIFGERN